MQHEVFSIVSFVKIARMFAILSQSQGNNSLAAVFRAVHPYKRKTLPNKDLRT